MDSKPELLLKRMVVEVTSSCNNRCLHCYNYWLEGSRQLRKKETLPRETVRALVRKVKRDVPLRQVAISGGEPMSHGDLPEIVCDLADDGLHVGVITNGTLLASAPLERYPGEMPFEVTLFSADAELHDRIAGRKVFHRVVEGLVRVEQYHGRFILACVVTRENYHDIFRTIQLGIALGADAVLLNRVNLGRHNFPMAERLVPSAAMLREALDAAVAAVKRYGIMVAVSVPIPPCILDPRDYPDLHFGWCPRGNQESYYTIGTDGHVRPCNHTSCDLGDLNTRDFAEIVNGAKTKEFWAPVPDECLRCEHPLKDLCRGGCPAAADECYGTRERIDPFVEAVRAGDCQEETGLRHTPELVSD